MLLVWETAAGLVASCGYRVTLGSWAFVIEPSRRVSRKL